MSDCPQAGAVQALAGFGEQVERGAQRRLVIGDPAVAVDLSVAQRQRRCRGVLSDPLDDAVCQRSSGIRLDELVFQ